VPRSPAPYALTDEEEGGEEEDQEEEEEEFITSGNWRGKHNSLSRGAGGRPTLDVKRETLAARTPHYDEHYAPTLPRICCHALSRRPPWSLGPPLSSTGGPLACLEQEAESRVCFLLPRLAVLSRRPP